MKTKSTNVVSFANLKSILKVTATSPRVVTPDNPLKINYTPAIFDVIEIQGGQIYAQIETKVEINSLTKTS